MSTKSISVRCKATATLSHTSRMPYLSAAARAFAGFRSQTQQISAPAKSLPCVQVKIAEVTSPDQQPLSHGHV